MIEEIKERPILFNSEMVRALLEGRKTVMRRLIKPQPDTTESFLRKHGAWVAGLTLAQHINNAWQAGFINIDCPYGRPGDRLWVRETFADLRGTGIEHRPDPAGPLERYAFAADSPPGSASDEARKDFGVEWRPSIHMPRSACRIKLEITAVRVERLQDITPEQCRAEGIVQRFPNVNDQFTPDILRGAFAELWMSTGGDWRANPWVWVVEFKRVTK